jgi:hypothetical protein
MVGPLVLVAGLALAAGLCGFLIEYDQALHRFPKDRARRHGLKTGGVAAAFFAALGVLLVALLLR